MGRRFEDFVERSILVNNEFGIEQVNSLASLKSMNLDRQQYPFIVTLIKKSSLAEIQQLPQGTESKEYLEIMQFEDQHKQNYYVTVYDSDAIYQDP